MADQDWRSNPHLAAAAEYCKRFGFNAVVIVAVEPARFRTISYGRNGAQCRAAGEVAASIAELIEGRLIEIPDVLRQRRDAPQQEEGL